MTDDLSRRIDRLEYRADQFEARIHELSDGLSETAENHAVTRQEVRIFAELLSEVRKTMVATQDSIISVREMFIQHNVLEARDRQRLLIGVLSSAATGLLSIILLAWGVIELLAKSG